ncbi:unnamed protein product, partial [Phaeothamnion confervicola]
CKNCGAENADDAVYCEDCGAQLGGSQSNGAEASSDLAVGKVVDGRFKIEALLEAGPISRYRATQGDKSYFLLHERSAGHLAQQRTVLQPLRSKSVIAPAEFFQEGDQQFAVGDLPSGERLEDLVNRQGPLEEAQVDHLARKLLPALSDVHEHGVLSRALQPSRIWLGEDGTVLLDLWERAVPLDGETEETDSIAVTPGFSAPEIYGLGETGPATDLFSAGAVLHYSLSGSRPNFESRESFFAVAPPPIEEAHALGYVIMRSLSKNPKDRFPDADTMAKALDEPPAGTVVALKTDIGCVRSVNQDACLELKFTFWEKSQPCEAHLITVIDGMGGEAEGDKAASIALRTIAQEVVLGNLALRDGRQTTPLLPSEPGERCRMILQRALLAANRNIFDYASLNEARRGMGCTISACILLNGTAHFAHVGDTRGYHMRAGEVSQVTTDHSLVGRLVAMGTLTPEEARNSPQRSIIFRAMGTAPDLEVDLYDVPVAPGDRIVLCSDGVWEYYEASEFAGIVAAAPDPASLCRRLVETCLQRGADDNATLAVIDV